jgi:hypothetical protein
VEEDREVTQVGLQVAAAVEDQAWVVLAVQSDATKVDLSRVVPCSNRAVLAAVGLVGLLMVLQVVLLVGP